MQELQARTSISYECNCTWSPEINWQDLQNVCQEVSHSRNDHGGTAGLLKVAASYQDKVEKISRQGTREKERES